MCGYLGLLLFKCFGLCKRYFSGPFFAVDKRYGHHNQGDNTQESNVVTHLKTLEQETLFTKGIFQGILFSGNDWLFVVLCIICVYV